MSRSRRFSGNLIVQPEVVEQRLRTGVASVCCPAWRGHIALVGETRRFHSEPGRRVPVAMFHQQSSRSAAKLPSLCREEFSRLDLAYFTKYLGQLRWGHIYQKIVSPESQPVYLFCASSVKLSNSFDCGDYEQSCFGKRTSGILGPHNDAGNNIGWHTLVLIIGSGLEHQTSPRRGHCTPSFCGGQYQKYCVKPWRRRKRVERSINLRKTHSFHYPKGGG